MPYYVFRNLDDEVDFKCNFPGKTTIGRSDQNNWTPPNSKAVSKEHAVVEISQSGGAVIEDLESRNGTFIGHGNPIEWHKVRGQVTMNQGRATIFFCTIITISQPDTYP